MSSLKHRTKSHLISFLKMAFAAIIIFWLIQTGKLEFKTLRVLLKLEYFLTLFSLLGINLLLVSERWRLILKTQNLPHSRIESWRLSLIGVFFNFIVPGGVGGDIMKAYYIAKGNPTAKTKSVVTVAMDRLLGLYTMLVMAVFVMLLHWADISTHSELKMIFIVLSTILVGFSLFWAIVFSKRLSSLEFLKKIINKLPHSQKLEKAFFSFTQYTQNKSLMFQAMTISLLAQVFSILFFYAAGVFLGFDQVSIALYFYVVPIGFMVTAIPISPAGVGLGQAAFYYLFNIVTNSNTSIGAATVTASQIFMFLFGLIGAYYYISIKDHRYEHI